MWRLLVLLAGCGRIDFDPLSPTDGSTSDDTIQISCTQRLQIYPQAPAYVDAIASCASGNGWLVTIDDATENAAVLALLTSKGAWIGLNDRALEDAHEWIGPPSSYRNWKSGQPDNGGGGGAAQENCVLMELDGTWSDEVCQKGQPYVCECP